MRRFGRPVCRLASGVVAFGAIVGVSCGLLAAETERRAVSVRVDPRVELVSIVFFLASNSEYSHGQVRSYQKDVEESFAQARSHELIGYAAGLRQKYGVSYDACMSLAVHLESEGPFRLRFPLKPRPDGLDGRWQDRSAEEFASRLNQFAEDSKFHDFFQQHHELYATTEQRLRALLEKEVHLEWFDEFFGARPSARFTLIPGLVNGGSCYGPHVKTPDGQEEFYCILGVWKSDWLGYPTFDATIVGTIIHEFCHSYANGIIDRHKEEFRPAGEALFAHVRDDMGRQAYGAWETMMYESLVRASVIRYMHRFESRAVVLRRIGQENQRGFVWMEDLSDLLGEYEEDRDRYATLEDFAPRIVEFFRDYSKQFAAKRATAPPPQIVAMAPQNGDDQVDPAVKQIRVQFDRPMRDGSWSMCGGGEHFPEVVGTPSYDENRKIWTVGVRLKPDHEYYFSLNSKWFRGFQTADGVALEPVEVRFKTAAGAAKTPSGDVR